MENEDYIENNIKVVSKEEYFISNGNSSSFNSSMQKKTKKEDKNDTCLNLVKSPEKSNCNEEINFDKNLKFQSTQLCNIIKVKPQKKIAKTNPNDQFSISLHSLRSSKTILNNKKITFQNLVKLNNKNNLDNYTEQTSGKNMISSVNLNLEQSRNIKEDAVFTPKIMVNTPKIGHDNELNLNSSSENEIKLFRKNRKLYTAERSEFSSETYNSPKNAKKHNQNFKKWDNDEINKPEINSRVTKKTLSVMETQKINYEKYDNNSNIFKTFNFYSDVRQEDNFNFLAYTTSYNPTGNYFRVKSKEGNESKEENIMKESNNDLIIYYKKGQKQHDQLNKDKFFILVDGIFEVYCLIDGHGPYGDCIGQFVQNRIFLKLKEQDKKLQDKIKKESNNKIESTGNLNLNDDIKITNQHSLNINDNSQENDKTIFEDEVHFFDINYSKIFTEIFDEIQKDLIDYDQLDTEVHLSYKRYDSYLSGASVCIIVKIKNILYIANVGNVMAMLLGDLAEPKKYDVNILTIDDSDLFNDSESKLAFNSTDKIEFKNIYDDFDMYDEIRRIYESGGEIRGIGARDKARIFSKGEYYPSVINTRSLGDHVGSLIGVIHKPHINRFVLNKDSNSFLFMCTDGIWNNCNLYKTGLTIKDRGLQLYDSIRIITNDALSRYSEIYTPDISIILLKLRKSKEQKEHNKKKFKI